MPTCCARCFYLAVQVSPVFAFGLLLILWPRSFASSAPLSLEHPSLRHQSSGLRRALFLRRVLLQRGQPTFLMRSRFRLKGLPGFSLMVRDPHTAALPSTPQAPSTPLLLPTQDHALMSCARRTGRSVSLSLGSCKPPCRAGYSGRRSGSKRQARPGASTRARGLAGIGGAPHLWR